MSRPHLTQANMPSISVFCSSSEELSPLLYGCAEDLGQRLAKQGYEILFGGARFGMMGRLATCALAAGGRVHGILPKLAYQRGDAHPNLSKLTLVSSISERKRFLIEHSQGVLVLPGGIGTLDEFFQVLAMRQENLHQAPLVLVNPMGFWDSLLECLDILQQQRVISHDPQTLFEVKESSSEVLQYLQLNIPSE